MKTTNLNYILLILFTSILLSGCKKDLTNKTDITNSEWRVEWIKKGIIKKKVPNKDHHGKSITETDYVLNFQNDSIYLLSLGINTGAGKFKIETPGEIEIKSGGETEICCNSNFDDDLSDIFSTIDTYKVEYNTLILNGEDGTIQFEKK